MENFKDIAETLLTGGGALQVPLDALAMTLDALFNDRARQTLMGTQALAVVEKARGATERTLDLPLERPVIWRKWYEFIGDIPAF